MKRLVGFLATGEGSIEWCNRFGLCGVKRTDRIGRDDLCGVKRTDRPAAIRGWLLVGREEGYWCSALLGFGR